MKNYIRSNRNETVSEAKNDAEYSYPTSYEYMCAMLKKAAVPGGLSDPECLVAFGAAMHVLEDYYAHSNFAEISLIKTYSPYVFPWVEVPDVLRLNKGSLERHNGWTEKWKNSPYAAAFSNNGRTLTTKANTATNPALDKNNPACKGEKDWYYSAAEYFPVVTGSFGLSDTMASVLPKMNNKLFNPAYQEPKNLREGERTMQDALILMLLEDISKAQDTDYAQSNGALKGKSNADYAKNYEW